MLTEWITGIPAESALWIHLILYSKEQLHKEGDLIDADWGLVSINASNNEVMEPMRPITAMRNALGIEEGGSGVSLGPRSLLRKCRFLVRPYKDQVLEVNAASKKNCSDRLKVAYTTIFKLKVFPACVDFCIPSFKVLCNSHTVRSRFCIILFEVFTCPVINTSS